MAGEMRQCESNAASESLAPFSSSMADEATQFFEGNLGDMSGLPTADLRRDTGLEPYDSVPSNDSQPH